MLANYKKILTSFSPIIPHLTSECLKDIGNEEELIWPSVNEDYLKNESIDYVIQINGKKRTIINAEMKSICCKKFNFIQSIFIFGKIEKFNFEVLPVNKYFSPRYAIIAALSVQKLG